MSTAQFLSIVGSAWLTVVGLIIGGVRLLMSGSLVPRSQVDALTVQWEARITESLEREQAWHTAYDTERLAGDVRDKQISGLMDLGTTTVALLRALPRETT